MQLVEENPASQHFASRQVDFFPKVPANLSTTETDLCEMRIDKLREAIRKNQVSFPSQVPTFPKHDRPDLHRKLVQLYFALGWNSPRIGARYGLSRLRVQQILHTWRKRAVELGYLQSVPPAASLKSAFEHPPIQVVLSAVTHHSYAPVIPRSAPSGPRLLDHNQTPYWTDPRRSLRPRKRLEIANIPCVVKQPEAGTAVPAITDEVGVSVRASRAWKEQHELRMLRRENAQLKERLAHLGAIEKTLIDLITRSDNAQPASFMPFSRVSHHTESDYRESL